MARRRRSLLGRRPDGGDDPSEEPADAPSLEDAPGVSAAPVVPDVPGTTVDPAVPAEADRGADPERSAFEASFGASRTPEGKASDGGSEGGKPKGSRPAEEADRGADPERSAFEASFGASRTPEGKASDGGSEGGKPKESRPVEPAPPTPAPEEAPPAPEVGPAAPGGEQPAVSADPAPAAVEAPVSRPPRRKVTVPADRLPPVYTPRHKMLTRGRRRTPRRRGAEVGPERFLLQLALTFAIVGTVSFGVGAAGLFVLRGEVFRLLGW